MPFVKLDTRILDSTLWVERECREIFLTALLMAEPYELSEYVPQIKVRTPELTGFDVPPGWYGFIPCAGIGIVRRAMVTESAGYEALEKLGSPDLESRSNEFDGRRLVRIAGGFVVLNYMRYRDRDYTAADRAKRYREKRWTANNSPEASHRDAVTSRRDAVTSRRDAVTSRRDITQAESREAEEITKTKNQQRAMHAAAVQFALPDWLPLDPWKGFLEMRRKAGKSPTDRAKSLLVKKLATLMASGQDPGEVLDQSTERAWTGLFEVKSQGSSDGTANGKLSPGAARFKANEAANERATRTVARRLGTVSEDDGEFPEPAA